METEKKKWVWRRQDPCPVEREFRLYYEAHDGHFADDGPGISEIFDYEYRIPFENEFDFDHCGF